MDGVSGISNVYSPAMAGASTPAAPAATPPAAAAQPGTAAQSTTPAGAVQSQEWASLSSLSVNQSSESLLIVDNASPAAVSNELVGAILLFLLLEYMKSGSDEEKRDLLGLMGAIVQMQQTAGGQSSVLMYSSSSLSMESTQLQLGSSSTVYTNAGLAQSPGADPGAGGLDVTA